MIESLRNSNQRSLELEESKKTTQLDPAKNMDDFRYMDDVTFCQAMQSRRVVVNLLVLLVYWYLLTYTIYLLKHIYSPY